MGSFIDMIYYADDPLKTLVALMAFSFAFEFVLSLAYILKSAKSGLGV